MKPIKGILTSFLYFLGIEQKQDADTNAEQEQPVYAGPQIIDSASAVFVHHNDNVALVVDYEFEDVPSWVEWDVPRRKMAIAQMGGTITELETAVEDKTIAAYKEQRKLYLVANCKGEKIIHRLTFIVREQ